jgi:hypothetical protein
MDRLERRLVKPGDGSGSPPAVPSPQPEPAQAASARGDTPKASDELARAAAPLVTDGSAATQDTQDLPPIDISFEQLQRVWPGLFGGLRDLLGARRWAFFREAVPAAVERNTIILEVAHDFHLTSLEQDDAVAPIVAAKASDLLGGPVKVKFRLKSQHEQDPEDDRVDLSKLEERPGAETDPAALLESELGARVVDE